MMNERKTYGGRSQFEDIRFITQRWSMAGLGDACERCGI